MDEKTAARFWSKVDRRGPDECWLWTGTRHNWGYGMFTEPRTKKRFGAHRAAYAEKVGPIPPGMFVCHSCDVPACVNPAHLFLGTHVDNMRDMVAKGRGRTGGVRGERMPNAKLTPEDIREIRRRLAAGHTGVDIGVAFGIHHRYASMIARRKRWAHVE